VADLRRVFGDVGRVQARLATAVNLRLLGELGLPLVLFESMTAIAEAESCRVQELTAGLGVSAGSASKLADRLCALGYCRRLPNPEDRRSCLLRLTPAGRRKLLVAGQSVDQELECLLKPVLSAIQITQFAATLRALRCAGPGARSGTRACC
jgi:MarR family transcriptional regulator, organic hydroperoxide resistance regulator